MIQLPLPYLESGTPKKDPFLLWAEWAFWAVVVVMGDTGICLIGGPEFLLDPKTTFRNGGSRKEVRSWGMFPGDVF